MFERLLEITLTQLLEILIEFGYVLFIFLPLHEFGHWIAMRRCGITEFEFEYGVKYWILPFLGFHFESELETKDDLHDLNFILASGSLFSIIGICVGVLVDLFSLETGFLFVLMSTLYMFWEITHA